MGLMHKFAAGIEQEASTHGPYRGTEVYGSTEQFARERAEAIALDWSRERPGVQVDVAYYEFMPATSSWKPLSHQVHVVSAATK